MKGNIVMENDKMMNPACNVCTSKSDVKQILFNCHSYGTGIVLCKDCRKKLIKLLIQSIDFDSVSDFISVLS